MKRLIWISLLLLSAQSAVSADDATVVEIEVSGMICAFCVEGLRSSLIKLPGIEGAEVSLKHSLARIELEPEYEPDIDAIKQAIVDAGFTPGDVRDIS